VSSVVVGRGFVFDPKGKQVIEFAWGIGITSNNMVEALALLQDLSLL